MFDQSFSAKHCRKIFDYEKRKGNNLEKFFFKFALKCRPKIKDLNNKLKELNQKKTTMPIEDYEKRKKIIIQKKSDLKNEKESLLSKEFESISSQIRENSFKFNLKEIDRKKEKKIYTYERDVVTYFTLKQLQNYIRNLYKIKPANRHQIVCQVRSMLSNTLPKHVIKTDISNFYESINTKILLKNLNDDPQLTVTSKKMISIILNAYFDVKAKEHGEKSEVGVPRGVGVSAYLVELYMRQFDQVFLSDPQVLYYARYVDDIIIIYTTDNSQEEKIVFLDNKLKAIGLTRNKEKTKELTIEGQKNGTKKIDYLGYCFVIDYDSTKKRMSVRINLAESKIDKYKQRLNLAFFDYENTINLSRARSLLLKRIRFLTGNTRLLNNKKNVLLGIYFSHSVLNLPDASLIELDKFLEEKTNKIKAKNLKKSLLELSFKKGFEEKRFFKFSRKDFKNITKVWKDAL